MTVSNTKVSHSRASSMYRWSWSNMTPIMSFSGVDLGFLRAFLSEFLIWLFLTRTIAPEGNLLPCAWYPLRKSVKLINEIRPKKKWKLHNEGYLDSLLIYHWELQLLPIHRHVSKSLENIANLCDWWLSSCLLSGTFGKAMNSKIWSIKWIRSHLLRSTHLIAQVVNDVPANAIPCNGGVVI